MRPGIENLMGRGFSIIGFFIFPSPLFFAFLLLLSKFDGTLLRKNQ
jgi:hypothetical protein